jgi:hypothetical protein
MPKYNEAGRQLKEEHLYKIGSINARDNQESAKKYKITKFPTILYFQSGSYVEYKHERSVEGFRDYVIKMKSPGGKVMKTLVEVRDFIEK